MSYSVINSNISGLNIYTDAYTRQGNNTDNSYRNSTASHSAAAEAVNSSASLDLSGSSRRQIKSINAESRKAQEDLAATQRAKSVMQSTHTILSKIRRLSARVGDEDNTSIEAYEIRREVSQLVSKLHELMKGDSSDDGGTRVESVMSYVKEAFPKERSNNDADTNTEDSSALDDISETVDKTIAEVLGQQESLSEQENQLERTEMLLDSKVANFTGSGYRLRNSAMASELMSNMKSNILAHAGRSVLAQANQNPKQVLDIIS